MDIDVVAEELVRALKRAKDAKVAADAKAKQEQEQLETWQAAHRARVGRWRESLVGMVQSLQGRIHKASFASRYDDTPEQIEHSGKVAERLVTWTLGSPTFAVVTYMVYHNPSGVDGAIVRAVGRSEQDMKDSHVHDVSTVSAEILERDFTGTVHLVSRLPSPE